jgi:hypothetical protein
MSKALIATTLRINEEVEVVRHILKLPPALMSCNAM